MSLEKLQEFISTKSKNEEDKKIDWEKRKNDWISSVEDLYLNVEKWLKPLIDKDQIDIDYKKITLNEEYIGEYDIKSMQIFISNEKVELIPIGVLIVGSHGRIDITGKSIKMRVVLVNEEIELVWKIATSPPNVKLLSLNDDSFSDILLEIIR